MQTEDFQEIGHTGGKVTFKTVTDAEGHRKFDLRVEHSREVPAGLFAVWALPQGVPVAGIQMGGIGVPWSPDPIGGCYPVMIGSDSQGKFGHQCPSCHGYWRGDAGPAMCPYCATRGALHVFLSEAQRRYVVQYCQTLQQALGDGEDGEYVIDMDAVAEAVGRDVEKPPFYYVEESQQKRFHCTACGAFNDILGRFGYCTACGSRNDPNELDAELAALRANLNTGGRPETCVCNAVSVFDVFIGQYVRQLIRRVPLRSARRARLEHARFHDLQRTATEIKGAFDIDIFENLKAGDIAFAVHMFHRRHVYEHHGGVVDEKYLADSLDTSVRLGQEIHETQESAHRLIGLIAKTVENLHNAFHDIFPPEAGPISRHHEAAARMRHA